VKRGKKSRKRKRGPAGRARIRELGRRQHRLAELEEETRECYESVLERYPLSAEEQKDLEYEWKLGLETIADYEDATLEDYLYLDTGTYESEPLSDLIEWGVSEAFWRASFDLANALGLALVTIDEAGNINGERVNY
jgi:hypothetical protein